MTACQGAFSGQRIIQLPNYSMAVIFALSLGKHSGIQLHSSQNNNVMLFFVVRSAARNETNPFIFNHLHEAWRRFPQLWKFLGSGAPRLWVPGKNDDLALGQFATTGWLTTFTRWN